MPLDRFPPASSERGYVRATTCARTDDANLTSSSALRTCVHADEGLINQKIPVSPNEYIDSVASLKGLSSVGHFFASIMPYTFSRLII